MAPNRMREVASAIALRTFIAAVACSLFGLGLLGAAHERVLWQATIGPQIKPKVLPHVYSGIDETVHHVLNSSSAGLLALASALAVWEVSGIIRASIGALDEIYETPETRPFWIRFPLSWGLAILWLAPLGRSEVSSLAHLAMAGVQSGFALRLAGREGGRLLRLFRGPGVARLGDVHRPADAGVEGPLERQRLQTRRADPLRCPTTPKRSSCAPEASAGSSSRRASSRLGTRSAIS